MIASKNKVIGANITDLETSKAVNIRKEDFNLYIGCIENAVATVNNVIRAKKGNLRVVDASKLLHIKPGSNISTYTIMHKDTEVLKIDTSNETVEVYNTLHIPFGLKSKNPLKPSEVTAWIRARVNNINRIYMNLVYIAREVGRDSKKVIKDSCGISFTDNYWIKTNDILVDWNRLRRLRDTNGNLNDVALTGRLNLDLNLKDGYTTLFVTKGYFPKAVYNGWIYKRKEDAILEYPAYLIGKQLGIDTSEVKIIGDYVGIKIFTSENISLVHASELKEYYGSDDELYNIMYSIGRTDIAGQMQRMFIFNYIIGNPDLHEDNYGLLYNPDTMDILKLSPCYDHNIAFQEGFNGLSRGRLSGSSTLTLDEYTNIFIKGHKDIAQKLSTLDLSEVSKYLNQRQLSELKSRIKTTLYWS